MPASARERCKLPIWGPNKNGRRRRRSVVLALDQSRLIQVQVRLADEKNCYYYRRNLQTSRRRALIRRRQAAAKCYITHTTNLYSACLSQVVARLSNLIGSEADADSDSHSDSDAINLAVAAFVGAQTCCYSAAAEAQRRKLLLIAFQYLARISLWPSRIEQIAAHIGGGHCLLRLVAIRSSQSRSIKGFHFVGLSFEINGKLCRTDSLGWRVKVDSRANSFLSKAPLQSPACCSPHLSNYFCLSSYLTRDLCEGSRRRRRQWCLGHNVICLAGGISLDGANKLLSRLCVLLAAPEKFNHLVNK